MPSNTDEARDATNERFLPHVVVLNGTSSSGKTSIARVLQETLRPIYLSFSIDCVLYALPPSDLRAMMLGRPIQRPDYEFGRLVKGFHAAAAGLLRTGNRLIIDNATTCEEWRLDLVQNLAGHEVLWVGVYCDVAVASARELARGDRAVGTAAYEAPLVHRGFDYDVTVDTTSDSPDQAAAIVMEKLSSS